MKQIIALLLLLLLCISCGTTKKAPQVIPPVVETTKVVERTSFIHDTLYIEIPAQTAERTTNGSTSNLETDYAVSTARINQDGTLYHDLKNKAQKKPVPHDTPVLSKDSIVYKEKPVPYPVEKELTKWETLSIEYFKWLLPLFLAAAAWIFRKPILAIVRRFI